MRSMNSLGSTSTSFGVAVAIAIAIDLADHGRDLVRGWMKTCVVGLKNGKSMTERENFRQDRAKWCSVWSIGVIKVIAKHNRAYRCGLENRLDWDWARARARASGPMRLSGGLSCRRSLCRGIGSTSSRRGSSSSTRGRRWIGWGPRRGGERLRSTTTAAATSVVGDQPSITADLQVSQSFESFFVTVLGYRSDSGPHFLNSCFSTEALETDILGHGKQGCWHLYSEESGHGFMRSRSNEKIINDESFWPSDSRADGKYSRNGRENRGSFSEKGWKCHS
ncbi:hypothetical protein RHMOL_Rhmol10G0141700 [Rhododendron molle]|uniref:Uncharacterized protein n=3 Tax=Rhododendron molle TaxID=49168 RepID=A0ACC0M258_RHOML|nr:hypothetical protein RHMOL_Rhmol10G0141700 [Rhododendron molle]KAI8535008.1 hypothetical protein RHMOL_Rhmol10G0141700 [Rhododendron molle]KAI8535010.1 hypothetical protein RHMOL_Rhmol10G0141700 [Rhododendron molle]